MARDGPRGHQCDVINDQLDIRDLYAGALTVEDFEMCATADG